MPESLIDVAVLGKLLFGLVLVLGTLAFFVFFLRFLQRKKMFFAGKKSDLQVVQTSYIGNKQRLSVLHWGESRYLVAFTEEGGFLIDKKNLVKTDVKIGK